MTSTIQEWLVYIEVYREVQMCETHTTTPHSSKKSACNQWGMEILQTNVLFLLLVVYNSFCWLDKSCIYDNCRKLQSWQKWSR